MRDSQVLACYPQARISLRPSLTHGPFTFYCCDRTGGFLFLKVTPVRGPRWGLYLQESMSDSRQGVPGRDKTEQLSVVRIVRTALRIRYAVALPKTVRPR